MYLYHGQKIIKLCRLNFSTDKSGSPDAKSGITSLLTNVNWEKENV